MHIYSKNTPTADAHVVSQSLSRLICCCLGLCHGWCWNSKILLSWQTLYCWKLPHVSCRSGEISQGWAHILLPSSVAMMIAEQFIWISVKFINNNITCIHSYKVLLTYIIKILQITRWHQTTLIILRSSPSIGHSADRSAYASTGIIKILDRFTMHRVLTCIYCKQ